MLKYESVILDASSSMKGKLDTNDISILDETINKRATDGWEPVACSFSLAGFAQFLLIFKKEQ